MLGILVAAMMLTLSRWPSNIGETPQPGQPGETTSQTNSHSSSDQDGGQGSGHSDRGGDEPADQDAGPLGAAPALQRNDRAGTVALVLWLSTPPADSGTAS